jgi:hypothetical protein
MKVIAYTALVLLSVFALICNSSKPIVLDSDCNRDSIQIALDSNSSIRLPNKTIEVDAPIILSRSNQKLIGGTNTVLVLKSNANCPVIIIGLQENVPIQKVSIENIRIDGNRLQQTNETWKPSGLGHLMYNNGIIVQNARSVSIKNVTVYNCRSGGLVSTYHVSRLTVDSSEFYNNQFDGIACYQTTKSVFKNSKTHDNLAAGISLDLDFNRNDFKNMDVYNNDIGIFMRKSNGNMFDRIYMAGNRSHDIFMSSVDDLPNTGCSQNTFVLTKNRTIYDRDMQCVSNTYLTIPLDR